MSLMECGRVDESGGLIGEGVTGDGVEELSVGGGGRRSG